MPEISVIIPCYNQEKYISECIDSVLVQTFRDFEIIVINDGSTDKSLEIISKYVNKYPSIITCISQRNQGIVATRNNGIAQAKGTYIYPLDGDDKIAPTCLEKLYNAMQAQKGDVIYSQTYLYGERRELFDLRLVNKYDFARGNCVVCSALYRKRDWEKYHGYDQNLSIGCEDWGLWMAFLEDGKQFHRIDEVLFFYRIQKRSRNHTAAIKNDKLIRAYLRKKYKKLHFYYDLNLQIQNIRTKKIPKFIYQKKKTSKGKTIVKLFRVPIYYAK